MKKYISLKNVPIREIKVNGEKQPIVEGCVDISVGQGSSKIEAIKVNDKEVEVDSSKTALLKIWVNGQDGEVDSTGGIRLNVDVTPEPSVSGRRIATVKVGKSDSVDLKIPEVSDAINSTDGNYVSGKAVADYVKAHETKKTNVGVDSIIETGIKIATITVDSTSTTLNIPSALGEVSSSDSYVSGKAVIDYVNSNQTKVEVESTVSGIEIANIKVNESDNVISIPKPSDSITSTGGDYVSGKAVYDFVENEKTQVKVESVVESSEGELIATVDVDGVKKGIIIPTPLGAINSSDSTYVNSKAVIDYVNGQKTDVEVEQFIESSEMNIADIKIDGEDNVISIPKPSHSVTSTDSNYVSGSAVYEYVNGNKTQVEVNSYVDSSSGSLLIADITVDGNYTSINIPKPDDEVTESSESYVSSKAIYAEVEKLKKLIKNSKGGNGREVDYQALQLMWSELNDGTNPPNYNIGQLMASTGLETFDIVKFKNHFYLCVNKILILRTNGEDLDSNWNPYEVFSTKGCFTS